jgi:hypothetical protein
VTEAGRQNARAVAEIKSRGAIFSSADAHCLRRWRQARVVAQLPRRPGLAGPLCSGKPADSGAAAVFG